MPGTRGPAGNRLGAGVRAGPGSTHPVSEKGWTTDPAVTVLRRLSRARLSVPMILKGPFLISRTLSTFFLKVLAVFMYCISVFKFTS